jgi:hypothetical protein
LIGEAWMEQEGAVDDRDRLGGDVLPPLEERCVVVGVVEATAAAAVSARSERLEQQLPEGRVRESLLVEAASGPVGAVLVAAVVEVVDRGAGRGGRVP